MAVTTYSKITGVETGSGSGSLNAKRIRTSRFVSIGSGTSGTITLPTSSTVILDDFGGTTDAILAKMSGGKPLYESATNAGGTIIGTSFDSSGNYTFTGTPSSYPVALVYRIEQDLVNFDSTSSDIVGSPQVASASSGGSGANNIDGGFSSSTYGGTTPIDGGGA